MNENTKIYITSDGVDQAKADGLKNVTGITPNMTYEESGIKIKTVAAYNNSPDRQNHKKEFNWVGYIVEMNGYSYYSAGDTDLISEMSDFGNVDVAFLPIDGKYNMDGAEAAAAANIIKPKVAVPYHYNNFLTEDKTLEFANRLAAGIDCAVLTFKIR